jgi:Uma2 family endonuclease
MADPAPRTRKGHYIYADYVSWPAEERWELIDGVAYDMSAAPSLQHQRVLGALFAQLRQQIGAPCEVLLSALDVRLPEQNAAEDERTETVVQPDILVVCDPEKLDDRGCLGPPDLIVEILSPHTAFKDMSEKVQLYERHGVREYWIVNPVAQYVLLFVLGDQGTFDPPSSYRNPASFQSTAFPDIHIELSKVFTR